MLDGNGNPIVRTARGGRANHNRPSCQDFEPKHKASTSALVAEVAALFDVSECEETIESHLIPRQSLAVKQHLALLPEQVEFERLKDTKRFQLDRKGNLVETSDPCYRLTWKSDRTLLRRGNPDAFGEQKNAKGEIVGTKFQRITARSKRKLAEYETKDSPQGTTPYDPTTDRTALDSSLPEDVIDPIQIVTKVSGKRNRRG